MDLNLEQICLHGLPSPVTHLHYIMCTCMVSMPTVSFSVSKQGLHIAMQPCLHKFLVNTVTF